MDPAGSTSVRYEVANALGELNRSRSVLAAYVDANRAGPTRASYANAAARLLRAVDLYCVRYGIREPRDIARLTIECRRKPYGATFVIDRPPERARRATAVGASPALEIASVSCAVGSEMGGSELDWLMSRTKRVAEWAANDNVADAIEELFHAIDRHCDVNGIDTRFLEVDAIFARGLTYVDMHFRDNTPDFMRRREAA